MIGAFIMPLGAYAGLVLGLVAVLRTHEATPEARPAPARMPLALRAAWVSAWLTAAAGVWLGIAPPVEGSVWLLSAGWTVALCLGQPKVLVLLGLVSLALVVALFPPEGAVSLLSAAFAVSVVGAVGCAAWVFHAARARRRPGLRAAIYWLSFLGTFAWLIPEALGDRAARQAHASLAAAALLLLAVPLALLASRAFAAAAGTPEPSDPPLRLVTTGIYAVIRQPIQLAEIACVLAGALSAGGVAPLVYAAGFALALVGPVRVLEARALDVRFGSDARSYRARVPAYVPRLSA